MGPNFPEHTRKSVAPASESGGRTPHVSADCALGPAGRGWSSVFDNSHTTLLRMVAGAHYRTTAVQTVLRWQRFGMLAVEHFIVKRALAERDG